MHLWPYLFINVDFCPTFSRSHTRRTSLSPLCMQRIIQQNWMNDQGPDTSEPSGLWVLSPAVTNLQDILQIKLIPSFMSSTLHKWILLVYTAMYYFFSCYGLFSNSAAWKVNRIVRRTRPSVCLMDTHPVTRTGKTRVQGDDSNNGSLLKGMFAPFPQGWLHCDYISARSLVRIEPYVFNTHPEPTAVSVYNVLIICCFYTAPVVLVQLIWVHCISFFAGRHLD